MVIADMMEEAPVRRAPAVTALAILANMTGIICLAIAIGEDLFNDNYHLTALIFGPYGVFRLIASYGLLRMKTFGLILERLSALLWVAIPLIPLFVAVRDFVVDYSTPAPLVVFVVVSGMLSLLEIWYLGRPKVRSRFAKRGQTGAPFPLVAKAVWFVGQLALLSCLHVALPMPAETIAGLLTGFRVRNETYQHRTRADMRTIADALDARSLDVNDYPFAASIEAIAPKLSPTYLKQVPLRDGWGNRWRYGAWKLDPKTPGRDHYIIISAGRDGRFEVIDPKLMEAFVRANQTGDLFSQKWTTNFDCDIVYSNGVFLQTPQPLSGNGN
ncbi:MAG: type II secretion system protein GspG [Acidobacteriota bacterium]|nr:type II secretion system protein GspG [Acidobacteriota bacterium]